MNLRWTICVLQSWTYILVLFTLVLGRQSIISGMAPMSIDSNQVEMITLGAGCFWCVEAIFEGIPGVISVESGYSGGLIKNPSYREVCTGRTGHAEVVQLAYNPVEVSLGTLLDVFFATHDPTTLNRQGADVGTQYRSAIFIHSEDQRVEVDAAMVRASNLWPDAIVTEIADFEVFYPAEDYHQAYYELNKEAPYCRAVIAPKLAKFKTAFGAQLKLD